MRRFIAPNARPYAYRVCFLGVVLLASCGGGSTDAPSNATSPDMTPPSAPASLAATAVSPAQVDLTWSTANDNVGVTGYRIERCQGASCSNFAQIAAPPATSFSDTGVTASTSYSYRVRATDAAGNLSSYSNTGTASTPASSDTTPPSSTDDLLATAVSSAQVNLTWDAATDDVGVTGYRVERCQGASCSNFAQIATPSGTSFNDTAVAASTSYSYRVRAADAAGNLGSYSNTSTASTPAALFTDDFNRADANPITPTTVWLNSGAQGGAIVSNQLTGGGIGDNFILVSASTVPAFGDQYAKITFVSTANISGNQSDSGGPMVRADGNGDGYLFDWISNKPAGQSTWTLYVVVGTVGQVGSAVTGTFGRALVDGDVVEIRAVGNMITGYLNGVAVPGATKTDSTYATGGFRIHLFSNTGRWDNFEGGSL
ncbi:MAG TPA: fibronectin type III domain-containing protein [Burkholderiales bacterium]|nr:fibronectin type III domain-containing protein [Burkholderiales bacterium]